MSRHTRERILPAPHVTGVSRQHSNRMDCVTASTRTISRALLRRKQPLSYNHKGHASTQDLSLRRKKATTKISKLPGPYRLPDYWLLTPLRWLVGTATSHEICLLLRVQTYHVYESSHLCLEAQYTNPTFARLLSFEECHLFLPQQWQARTSSSPSSSRPSSALHSSACSRTPCTPTSTIAASSSSTGCVPLPHCNGADRVNTARAREEISI